MTYDTLWIGCSFSAGVYNKDNEILDKLENNFKYDRAKFEKVIHDQN